VPHRRSSLGVLIVGDDVEVLLDLVDRKGAEAPPLFHHGDLDLVPPEVGPQNTSQAHDSASDGLVRGVALHVLNPLLEEVDGLLLL